MIKTLLIVAFLSSAISYSQDKKEKEQKEYDETMKNWDQFLEEKMGKQKEIMKKYLEMDSFKKIEDLFQQMQKDFSDPKFQKQLEKDLNQFSADFFGKFLERSGAFGHLKSGQEVWLETDKERVLVLKYKIDEKSPLDIEIQDGKISIKGEEVRERINFDAKGKKTVSKTRRSFQSSHNIPRDVDAEKAQIKKNGGDISVHFPKSVQRRKPLKPNKNDLTI